MLHPTVFNTSQICNQLGVKHAVLSPGSRNAPLTLSFARHPEIKKWIIPDERAAGFIALGIAQEVKAPVVLCCTSGTALLNYAPAIAEAFYREIPLIVLSADRPPELIDQRDGQTIRQFEALRNHVMGSFQLPVISSDRSSDREEEQYINQLVDAVNASKALPKGPVHINIPFREPFYPSSQDDLKFKGIAIRELSGEIPYDVDFNLPHHKKVLLLIGQTELDHSSQKFVQEVSKKIPVIRSPLNNLDAGIQYVDAFLQNQQELVPELLITTGLSVLSKKLKTFLRNNSISEHIHFDPAGIEVDTYLSNPKLIKAPVKTCLERLLSHPSSPAYLQAWTDYQDKSNKAIEVFIPKASFSETTATYQVLSLLPKEITLHLSNSMPVRYANLFGVKNGILSRSNRGTSGIDGCTSTAYGNALVSDRMNILITGDLAFLYDRNAFFHNYSATNLRIIVINNQGGGIFRLIDGPANLPELPEYFETQHNRTAEYICKENGVGYFTAKSTKDLEDQWQEFLQPSDQVKLMEVFTDPIINQKVYKDLKSFVHERINSME